MYRILSVLTLILTFSALSAQPPGGGGGRGNGQQPTGRLYGKIVDVAGKPVEYASVQLLANRMDTVTKQRKEVVINGQLTQGNGDFSLENVPVFGPLKLKVSAIGFKEITQ